MNKSELDLLDMLQTVQAYFAENHAAITAQIPAFAAQKTSFDALITGILETAAEAAYDRTGYAQDKKEARTKLENAMQRISTGAALYYTHLAPDEALADRLRLCQKGAANQPAATLIVNALAIHEVADTVKTMLVPYGISAAMVDALPALIDGFESLRSAPQESRLEAARYRKLYLVRLSEAKVLLRQIIDPMLELLQYDHDLLYLKYRNSRKIQRSGGPRQRSKPYTTLLQPGAIKALNTAPSGIIQEQTMLRLSSHTAEATSHVRVYFASDAEQSPMGGITLEARQQSAHSAQSLGYSTQRPLLLAHNNGQTIHTIGVLIQ